MAQDFFALCIAFALARPLACRLVGMAPKAASKSVLKRPASAGSSALKQAAVRKKPAVDQALAAGSSQAEEDVAMEVRVDPGRNKHDPTVRGSFNDPTLHAWSQVTIPDAEVRSQMLMQLQLSRRDCLGRLGRNHVVDWSSLTLVPDGFAIRFNQPRTFRVAHKWWGHRFEHVVTAPVGSHFVLTCSATAPSNVTSVDMVSTSSAAEPGAPPPVASASSAPLRDSVANISPRAPTAMATVSVHWPRFPARRLAGGHTLESGLGGTPQAYSGGTQLGKGTYGIVHKVSFGGHALAVKAFCREHDVHAWQEASVAEHVRGHPNLVHLLDACLRQSDGTSLLVYRFAGMSLRDALQQHEPSIACVRQLVVQVAQGLAHLHSRWLYHSDVKPANILVEGLDSGSPKAVLADLGGTIEVGPGVLELPDPRTTMWYAAPELLELHRTKASGTSWLKADVWALGIVICDVLDLHFFAADIAKLSDRQARMRQYDALGTVFPGYNDFHVESPVLTLAPEIRGRHGAAFMDCLEQLLTWRVAERPGIATCLAQPWMSSDALRYRHDQASLLAGDRHPWAYISGVMSQEVLSWLVEDFRDIAALRRDSHLESEDGVKTVLSGKLVDQPGSQFLNGLEIKEPLPCARLQAWMRAWKSCNAASLAQLAVTASNSVRMLMKSGKCRKNAQHFLDTPHPSWCLVAGQLHIFEEPGQLEEPSHHDGGASILHMGVTLSGRRRLRCFAAGAEGEYQDMPQMPGSVYLGTLTGCLHQVLHDTPRASSETLQGHSITLMARTSLFPHNRARNMNTFGDSDLVKCLAQAFSEALRDQTWILPSRQQCEQALSLESAS